jgi:hypothetical protein
MDPRKMKSHASATAPAAPVSPSTGYPTGGDPITGTPASELGAYWFYQLGEEIRAVIVEGGLTPALGVLTQLKTAIQNMISARVTGLSAVGSIDQGGVGAASTTYTASLSFTPPRDGKILIQAHLNIGGGAATPIPIYGGAGYTFNIKSNGVDIASDNTANPMGLICNKSVLADVNESITANVVTNASPDTHPPVRIWLGYVYVGS